MAVNLDYRSELLAMMKRESAFDYPDLSVEEPYVRSDAIMDGYFRALPARDLLQLLMARWDHFRGHAQQEAEWAKEGNRDDRLLSRHYQQRWLPLSSALFWS